MVNLHTLGRLDLTGGQGTDVRAVLSQTKPIAALVYLAVAKPEAFHRRDELLGLLWTETTTDKGRRALSQALHVLRDALGADLFESRGTDEIRLTPGALECDATEFRRSIDAGETGRAMRLYEGDLLPGFYVTAAGPFEEWLARERTVLRDIAAAGAWRMSEQFDEAGALPDAIEWARRAMELAPYDEKGIRRLMALHDRGEDRAHALLAFNEFSARLERDLSVKPSRETLEMASSIRTRPARMIAATITPPSTRSSTPPFTPSFTPPFTPNFTPSSTTAPVLAPAGGGRFRDVRHHLSRRRIIAASLVLTVIAGTVATLNDGAEPAATSRAASTGPEEILVAQFASDPADSALAATVTEAVRLDLSQAPSLRIMSGAGTRSTLRLMRRDTTTVVDSTVAREIAERSGVKAVLEGEVSRSGSAFVLSARLVSAEDGRLVQGWRVSARDSNAIIGAVDELTRALRQRVGESLASIEAGPRLLKLTTSSLPALRKQAMGMNAFYEEDYSRAARLYEEAIALDTMFADAYVSLVGALGRLEARPARQIEATMLAYRYRERLGDAERYAVEGNYHSRVSRDRDAAIDAFKNGAKLDPRGAYWGALGSLLIASKRYAEAERALVDGFRHQATPVMFSHLAHARFAQGDTAGARATLDSANARYPNRPLFTRMRVEMLVSLGEIERADSLVHAQPPSASASFPLRYQALIDAARGRTEEAMDHLRTLRASELASGSVPRSFSSLLLLERMELGLRGDTAAAIAAVEGALSRREYRTMDPRERPYGALAHFFLEAGKPERARALLEEHERFVPVEFRTDATLVGRVRAMLAAVEGTPTSLEALKAAAAGDANPHDALADLAWAYSRLNQPDSAAATFVRYVETPGLRRIDHDALHLRTALETAARFLRAHGRAAEAGRYETRVAGLLGQSS